MTAQDDDDKPSSPSSEASPAPPVTFLDSPFGPEVFADTVTGYFVRNGVISITFEAARINHVTSPGPLNRVVVGRVVLPISGAQELAVGLYDFLKSRGLAPNVDAKKAN